MEEFVVSTEEEFDIIYQTYRMRIITEYSLCPNMTATFKQIADKLGDNSAKVSYHGKMLIKIGLLKYNHSKNINGITAKYYKLVTDRFKIDFGDKDDLITQKRILKHKTMIIMDSLDRMKHIVGDLENEQRFITLASNDLYLTEEELDHLKNHIEELTKKNVPRPGTRKITYYTIWIDDNIPIEDESDVN